MRAIDARLMRLGVLICSAALSACADEPASIVTSSVAVADAAQSDRDLPRRPWLPVTNDAPGKTAPPAFTQSVTMKEAIHRAVERSPAVKAAFTEIEARHDDAAQASYKPNPELSLDIENFLGSGAKSGFRVAEETLRISQLIELGDKRLKRLRAANLEASVAGWDYEAARLAAASRAATAFVDVLVAQQRIDVLERFIKIADRTRSAVETQITAGKGIATDLDRASISVARAKAGVDGERARLTGARQSLSALWGSNKLSFERARGKLDATPNVPSLERVQTYLAENPALARWSDEIGRRHAMLDVERAKAVPDIKVALGIRHLHEDDTGALVATVAVPLQVFDRNNGNIAAANQRIQRAEFDGQAAERDVFSALVAAMGALRVAKAQINAVQSGVLPPSRSTVERTQAGYSEGRFDLFMLLDAQRSLLDAELELVTAQGDYAKAKVQVEILIGRGLEEAG